MKAMQITSLTKQKQNHTYHTYDDTVSSFVGKLTNAKMYKANKTQSSVTEGCE